MISGSNPRRRFKCLARTIPLSQLPCRMSAQEIIAELPGLSRPELEQVDSKLHQLLRSNGGTSAKGWGDALLEVAGTAEGLPSDFAHNHDHYLHGAPRSK